MPTRRTNKGRTRPPSDGYGAAQRRHIKDTRERILREKSDFFTNQDWTRIVPEMPGGRNACLNDDNAAMVAESFYVKAIAAWVPHWIIPNHVPTCPGCKENKTVDVNNIEWVDKPKILYGIRTHRYLDTVYYKCHDCNKTFTGYNEDSLKLDGQSLVGIFNFHLSKGLAVDEEVYSHIVNHSHDTTASIYRRLALGITDNYIDDATFYCQSVRANKVQKERVEGVVGSDRRQTTLEASFQRQEATQRKIAWTQQEQSKYCHLKHKLMQKQGMLQRKKEEYNDVDFRLILAGKSNRNKLKQGFSGLGRSKLEYLINERNIVTARQLLAYNGNDKKVLPSWRTVVRDHFKAVKAEMKVLEDEIRAVEDEIALYDTIDAIFREEEEEGNEGSGDNNNNNNNPATNPTPAPPPVARAAPPFSKIDDPHLYNARVVSKATIDRIVATDFLARKKLQDSKMRNIPCCVLKLDWHYKLPPKIKVYTRRGQSFAPYKSAISIQNEDSLTVFWKCYPVAEGLSVIKPDLIRLKKRLDQLGSTVHAIYVDNCCNPGVRNGLVTVFTEAEVKLDSYHWFARWDDILHDKRSAEAAIFRQLLRNACFFVEDNEKERVVAKLRSKLRREPTTKEIYKDAKAIIPPKEQLNKRVMAVMRWVYYRDAATDLRQATMPNATNGSSRFFKPMTDAVKHQIQLQLDHIRKGCLSDPPKEKVPITRVNPVTKDAFTARSTGTNEVDNRYLNRLLDTPSVGIARAERLISDHYERSNDRKRCRRLGEPEAISYRTERLYFLNSIAKSAGFSGDELPVKVAYPPLMPLQEYMGLQYELPGAFRGNSDIEGDDVNLAQEEEDRATDDLHNFLTGIDFEEEDEDIPVDSEQFRNGTEDSNNNNDDNQQDETDANTYPIAIDFDALQEEVAHILPLVKANETTFQTFCRLTADQPWVPFKHPKDPSFGPIDREEAALFDQMAPEYNRFAEYLDSTRGYKRFASKWDIEVADRFRKRAEGDLSIILIHRKSYEQLRNHFDVLRELAKTAQLRNHADGMTELNNSMKESARQMRRNPHQGSTEVAPAPYNNTIGRAPFGAPTVLNHNIARSSVLHSIDRNPNAPFELRKRRATIDPNTNPLGARFNRCKYCWKCGFRKKLHHDYNRRFGEECSDNNLREECSKCFQRLEFHTSCGVGPYCTFTAHIDSDFLDWYKQQPKQRRQQQNNTAPSNVI